MKAQGADPMASAKGQAAADLAGRITVRIESALRDQQEQKGDKYSQQIGTLTRTSTDVHLTGLSYETWQDGDRAWALAVLPRAAAAADRRRQRDQSLADAKAHRESAQQAKPARSPRSRSRSSTPRASPSARRRATSSWRAPSRARATPLPSSSWRS